jgi:putative FmdB family regulatory protein
MPIYEYRCQACGHTFEAIQKMADSALIDCPACHAAALKKLISAAGFQLKGTGWYASDFKGTKAKPTTSESSTDQAPETKTTEPATPTPSGSSQDSKN